MTGSAFDAAAWFVLAGRCLLAWLFIASAVDKLRDWTGGLAEVRAIHLPWPAGVLAGTVALQLVAGSLLALGWHVRVAAALLAAFTLFATLMAHAPWRLRGATAGQVHTTFREHLAIVGGLLGVAGHG
jgi:putative oxidoreductase